MSSRPIDQSADDLTLPLPVKAELPKLRAKVTRLKPPKLPAGVDWSNSIAGSFSTSSGPDGVVVTWQTIGGPKRSALFAALGDNELLEAERLELGWMIADMARLEARRMLEIIPGPNEAMSEANNFYQEENRWRCWSLLGSNPLPKPTKSNR
jgi:hypothetical protein